MKKKKVRAAHLVSGFDGPDGPEPDAVSCPRDDSARNAGMVHGPADLCENDVRVWTERCILRGEHVVVTREACEDVVWRRTGRREVRRENGEERGSFWREG